MRAAFPEPIVTHARQRRLFAGGLCNRLPRGAESFNDCRLGRDRLNLLRRHGTQARGLDRARSRCSKSSAALMHCRCLFKLFGYCRRRRRRSRSTSRPAGWARYRPAAVTVRAPAPPIVQHFDKCDRPNAAVRGRRAPILRCASRSALSARIGRPDRRPNRAICLMTPR